MPNGSNYIAKAKAVITSFHLTLEKMTASSVHMH